MIRLVLLGVLGLTLMTVAGDERGTGGDVGSGLEHSAWFLTTDVVPYCVEVSPNFDVPLKEVRQAIDFALYTWQHYILERLPIGDLGVGPNYALQYQERPNCDGKERLRFLFGIANEDVRDELIYYRDPAAFAARPTGLRPGFIWVGKSREFSVGEKRVKIDWRYGNALRGILLHEVGHMFGMQHIPGTVMTENILAQLGATPSSEKCFVSMFDYALSIDQIRELVPCVRCELDKTYREWKGTLGSDALSVKQNFKLIAGRDPVGDVKAKYVVSWHPDARGARLELSDKLSQDMEFPLTMDPSKPLKPDYGFPVFKKFFYNLPENHFSSHEYHSVGIVNGALLVGAKRRVPLRFSYNEGVVAPVHLAIPGFDSDSGETVFRSNAPDGTCLPEEKSRASGLGLPLPVSVKF